MPPSNAFVRVTHRFSDHRHRHALHRQSSTIGAAQVVEARPRYDMAVVRRVMQITGLLARSPFLSIRAGKDERFSVFTCNGVRHQPLPFLLKVDDSRLSTLGGRKPQGASPQVDIADFEIT